MYCVCFAGEKLRHRDYPSEHQKHLGDQLLLVSGVKRFVWVCVLVIYCNMGYFDRGSVECMIVVLNSLDRIPTAQYFLFFCLLISFHSILNVCYAFF